MIALVVSTGFAAGTILHGLPWPITTLVCLFAFVVCLFAFVLASAVRRLWRSPVILLGRTDAAQAPATSSDPPALTQPSGCPRIVIEYAYEDRDRSWPPLTVNNKPDAPLIVKNVSTVNAGYNIKVTPLTVEGVTATFQPALIPFIEAGGRAEVLTQIPGEGPLFRRGLPGLLRRSYRDASADELFGDKHFVLIVEYDDGGDPANAYETQCELLYRPWKDRVSMGKVKTRLRHNA
jgi:hypothetical protein